MPEVEMKDEFLITNPGTNHWMDIAELIAFSVPNALVSKLGPRFGTLYYEYISKHPLSCSYAAFDKSGRLAGIILGTLDRNSAKQLDANLKIRLLLNANFRLFSSAVIGWLIRGLRFSREAKCQAIQIPEAELVIVAVPEDFKGNNLANELISELESFFNKNNLEKPYIILTEKSNRVANKLYKKLGAKFIKTYSYHDKVINEWHKSLGYLNHVRSILLTIVLFV